MQLTPWYGSDPLIVLAGTEPGAIAEPLVRQRRRLAELLADFTDDQWAHASRCDGWSNRDVIVHLQSVNQFWGVSIAMGLKGEPTQFLATFDPVASPAQLVAEAPQTSTDELLEQFRASNDALASQVEALDADGWATIAEAPCGHVSIGALAHHALWDSLVHERDILLPQGIEATEEPDETLASLRYVAALSPAFALSRGQAPGGVLAVEPEDVDGAFTVTVADRVTVAPGLAPADADLVLHGPAVDLLEGLSLRTPLAAQVPDDQSWWVDGLKVTFDQAPA